MVKVSIPSRYDPNVTQAGETIPEPSEVSIPSRYDPNTSFDAAAMHDDAEFQSLQGTIQTLRFTVDRFGEVIGFNPFKVRSKQLLLSHPEAELS